MNKLPSKVTFSQGNDPPSYFELRQAMEQVTLAFARQYGLTADATAGLRSKLATLLNTEMRSVNIVAIHEPLPTLIITAFREKLMAFLYSIVCHRSEMQSPRKAKSFSLN